MSAIRPIALMGVLSLLGSAAQAGAPDAFVNHQIRQEAFKRSQVMDHLFYMTDVAGPRLTNSPGYRVAAEKIAESAREWGLENVAFETWEPFGRGWSTSHFSAHLVEPQYAPLIGVPMSWTPGTDGVVSGTPVLAILEEGDDFDQRKASLEAFIEEFRGKLAGKIVMMKGLQPVLEQTEAPSKRYSDGELAKRSKPDDPVEPYVVDPENFEIPSDREERRRFFSTAPGYLRQSLWERRRELRYQLHEFLSEEGVALVLQPGFRNDGGTVFPPGGGSHKTDVPTPPPSVALTPEHYNRIVRLIQRDIPPKVEVEVRARFHEGQPFNVVAEIPGGAKKDEVVIIGAHLDDVVYATGATDNAAGCAVMMEAMRILKALDLKMDRTVRMVLWDGEEQGLLGSEAYVKKHYGDPQSMELKPDHGKVSAYFNLDNGAGKIRGIYLQDNDMVRSTFSSWLAPFRDYGASTVTIRNTGGTDHLSFDAVGIPGFQFIQDPVEYSSRTHHSNMDVYDRVQASDLIQASAIVASFVYHTANHDELLPRKPLPEPWPEEYRDKD